MFVLVVEKEKVMMVINPYVMTAPHQYPMVMFAGSQIKIKNSLILGYLLSTPFVINTHITKGVFYAIR